MSFYLLSYILKKKRAVLNDTTLTECFMRVLFYCKHDTSLEIKYGVLVFRILFRKAK